MAPPFIEMPAHDESSTTIPSQMALLRHDLDLPDAQDPETRLTHLFPPRNVRSEL